METAQTLAAAAVLPARIAVDKLVLAVFAAVVLLLAATAAVPAPLARCHLRPLAESGVQRVSPATRSWRTTAIAEGVLAAATRRVKWDSAACLEPVSAMASPVRKDVVRVPFALRFQSITAAQEALPALLAIR